MTEELSHSELPTSGSASLFKVKDRRNDGIDRICRARDFPSKSEQVHHRGVLFQDRHGPLSYSPHSTSNSSCRVLV